MALTMAGFNYTLGVIWFPVHIGVH